MPRVALGGEGPADFPVGEHTDHCVKPLFPAEGVRCPEPFDLAAVRRDLPRDRWPTIRTCTVRDRNPRRREPTLGFALHGDEGPAGPWATRVEPGEEVLFRGPAARRRTPAERCGVPPGPGDPRVPDR